MAIDRPTARHVISYFIQVNESGSCQSDNNNNIGDKYTKNWLVVVDSFTHSHTRTYTCIVMAVEVIINMEKTKSVTRRRSVSKTVQAPPITSAPTIGHSLLCMMQIIKQPPNRTKVELVSPAPPPLPVVPHQWDDVVNRYNNNGSSRKDWSSQHTTTTGEHKAARQSNGTASSHVSQTCATVLFQTCDKSNFRGFETLKGVIVVTVTQVLKTLCTYMQQQLDDSEKYLNQLNDKNKNFNLHSQIKVDNIEQNNNDNDYDNNEKKQKTRYRQSSLSTKKTFIWQRCLLVIYLALLNLSLPGCFAARQEGKHNFSFIVGK